MARKVNVQEGKNVACDFMGECHEQGVTCKSRVKRVRRDVRVKIREVIIIDRNGDACCVELGVQGDVMRVVGKEKGIVGRVKGSEASVIESG